MSQKPENPRGNTTETDEPNIVEWLSWLNGPSDTETDEAGAAEESSTGSDPVNGEQASDPDWMGGSDGVGYPQAAPDNSAQADEDTEDDKHQERDTTTADDVDATAVNDNTDGSEQDAADDGSTGPTTNMAGIAHPWGDPDMITLDTTGEDTDDVFEEPSSEEDSFAYLDTPVDTDAGGQVAEEEPAEDTDGDPQTDEAPAPRSWMQELAASGIGSDADAPDGDLDYDSDPASDDTSDEAPTAPAETLTQPIPLARRRTTPKKNSAYLDTNTYGDKTATAGTADGGKRRGGGSRSRTVLAGKKGWIIAGAAGLALIGGVVYTSTNIMSDTDPVTAQAGNVQTSVAPNSDTSGPQIGPRAVSQNTGATPSVQEKTIGGTCATVEDSDLPVMNSGQKDPRSAWVTYNAELYNHNVDGIKAVLAGDSSLRNQDWAKVIDATPEGATFCLQMEPTSGSTLRGSLEVTTADGESTTYKQKATAVEADGRWYLTDITKDTRE
ncbi:hypothetical protein [Corynebacterium sp.]|uniref:hypothetical protein n=1 Tax=Corynebacterium sp. TaxID=1720 RepID=UPI0028B13E31|nr:hypothetical protein [Corynebacterium sp.]